MPVRVKKTRQNKNPEPGSDSIGTEKALAEAAWIERSLWIRNAPTSGSVLLRQKQMHRTALNWIHIHVVAMAT